MKNTDMAGQEVRWLYKQEQIDRIRETAIDIILMTNYF